MADPKAQASPERIQQMENFEAQAKIANRWMTHKKLEKNHKIEEEMRKVELASIENEIKNI